MVCCGKKTSILCMLLNIWGALQMALLGVFFSVHAVVLLEDLPLAHHYESLEDFREDADKECRTVALRCFIASVVFVIFFVLSFFSYSRSKTHVAKPKRQRQSPRRRSSFR